VCTLHLDRARKQDVVFQVDVLVQIGFQFGQRPVERLKANPSSSRNCGKLG
jgi:hypothetical protein